jgi:hypothetical protein
MRTRKLYFLVLIAITLTGCSVVMATQQPSRKDLSVLTTGVDRPRVISELGPPISSGEKDGSKTDIHSFKQGYSQGAKVGWTLFHGVADVFTLGLWEVVGTPVEAVATGTDMRVQVFYDKDDRVKEIKCFQGQEKLAEATGGRSGTPNMPTESMVAPEQKN